MKLWLKLPKQRGEWRGGAREEMVGARCTGLGAEEFVLRTEEN